MARDFLLTSCERERVNLYLPLKHSLKTEFKTFGFRVPWVLLIAKGLFASARKAFVQGLATEGSIRGSPAV